MSEFNLINDLTRELEKAHGVLRRVDEMMSSEASMNAAKHMSDRVLPNPLAAAVSSVITGIEFAVERGRAAGQGELPLDIDIEAIEKDERAGVGEQGVDHHPAVWPRAPFEWARRD